MAQIKTNLQYGVTGTVQTANIANDAIDSQHYAGTSVDNEHIGADFNASKIAAGTIATARLGSGTASSSTFLTGAQTYAAAGGGKILQVVGNVNQDSLTTSATTYTATGHDVTITPSATSSKIFVLWHGSIMISDHSFAVNISIHRDTTDLMGGDGGIYLHRGPTSGLSHDEMWSQSLHIVDSPSSTSEIVYQVYVKIAGSGTVKFDQHGIKNYMCAMEIDGS